MLVVDTNIISYLYLPTEYTTYSEALLKVDCQWVAPLIWKSEFRNVLALYMRKDILDLVAAMDIQSQAEELLSGNEFQVNSNQVLSLAQSSGCTAYDCEFIALAQSFDTVLTTTDRKLSKAFPDHTMTAKNFVEGKP